MLVHMYSFTLALSFLSLLCALSPALARPTRTTSRKSARWSSDFVTTSGDKFMLDGKEFRWVGTNAYWLPALNSEDDISDTLRNMSNVGIKVVRLWGHNDVTEIPTTGVYLALIKDGMVTINQGPNGFQRLDKVIELAKSFGIRVMLTFTNNWNIAPGSSSLPRNFLSNDYGGMDTYVREFGVKKTHDEFYTDQTIREKFYSYVEFVVKRYANEPGVLGWELANDARCESTLSTSDQCNTNVVTQWHADTANLVNSLDPNHPVAAGTHGFFCPSCPKLFAKTPAPQPSPAPGGSRKRKVGFLTPSKFFRMITEGRRATPRASGAREGFKIRGRWTAPLFAKRQTSVVGPAFNGVHGVDSEDILNIPGIDFHTFQTFPDQNDYETIGSQSQSPVTDFDQTIKTTTDWINQQLTTAKTAGKPSVHSAFGLVNQDNVQQFIQFNSSIPLAQTKQKYWKRQDSAGSNTAVSNQQVTNAYTSWGQTVVNGGGSGMNQYQWSSQNIQPAPGTVVQSPSAAGTVTQSPNDGYGIAGSDGSSVQQVLNTQSQNIQNIT